MAHGILPVDALHINQPKVCLVHQSRRLQRMAGTLVPHVAVRQVPKFVVQERREAVKRRRVASAPCFEQGCHFSRFRHYHDGHEDFRPGL